MRVGLWEVARKTGDFPVWAGKLGVDRAFLVLGLLDFFVTSEFIGLKIASLSGLFSGNFLRNGGLSCDSGVWDDR